MNKTKRIIARVIALALLLGLAVGPQFARLRHARAQNRNINVNEALDLNALGISTEVQRIGSLLGDQARFFRRGAELKEKSILSPRDPVSFRDEGEKRKADLATLQQQFQSLINKLKQGNHWDANFDAQFLAALKDTGDRSLLTQAGGARKLFEAGAAEFNGLQDDIDEEVRQINTKQTGRLLGRSDRVFAAHGRPPVGKLGCAALLASYILATASGSENSISCALAVVYNRRGCTPGITSGPACH